MAQTISVRIDAADVIHDIEQFAGAIELANISAVARIRSELRGIIREGFEIALDESGLHPIYQNHLRQGMAQYPPEVYATPDGLVAQYFDIESLGDYGDLEQGFHYHALLAGDSSQFSVSNPRLSELPYTGAELFNDHEKRYDFWQALVEGLPYEISLGGGINPRTGGRTPTHNRTIITTGLYEETLRARVNYWGDRYPEWLLLEYGQDFEPVTPPTHFKELTEIRVQEYMEEIYEEILDSIISVWEQETITTNSAGQLIEKGTGRFAKYLPSR